MTIAYLDCSSGISGDMLLGAFSDLGAPLEHLLKNLKESLRNEFRIEKKEVKRKGIRATKIDVVVKDGQAGKRFRDIRALIEHSKLKDSVKEKALEVFTNIFEAEAKVHGILREDVHLHELAAIDCLVDVIGTLLCIDYLELKEVYASSVNVGGGHVNTSHGLLPVPAPATAELLKGIPVYSSGVMQELTTPTGAAILRSIVKGFGPMHEMIIQKIGHGAGSMELQEQPNILRVFVGEKIPNSNEETVVVMETNIDDMNPQVYEYLIEKLLREGALEVYLTPVIMKKSRPGTLLTLLSKREDTQKLKDIVFAETTTLGIRYYEMRRSILKRNIQEKETEFGKIRFKVVEYNGIKRYYPEYEDIKKIAKDKGIPLRELIKRLGS
jgi:hypothetical protein